MPRSHFMIDALEYLAQWNDSSHQAATKHERPRSAGAAPTATGRSRAGRVGRHPVLMVAIALLVAALVGPFAAKADPSPMAASERQASATSKARAGDPSTAPSGDDWWGVLIGGGVLAAVAVASRAAGPRPDPAVAGAPLLAAARLLRDPKIRIESPLDDLADPMLDQSPLPQPDPTRAYWAAQAALDLRARRP